MTGAEENFISNEPVAIDGNNERTLPSETLGLFAADAPEWLSMDTVAAKGHVRRAPEQEQGQLNAAVFENLDGTYSMHYFGTDIKYVDEQGCERDKSTRLKPVTSGEYAFAVEDNNIRSLYPAQLSQETGVLLTDGAITIDIRPDSAANDAAREQAVPAADARSDKRTAKNGADRDIDRMLYQGVFGAGTALRYTPTFEGLKEDIILERPTEINRFSFLIRTGGLAVESNETEYQFVDGDGEIVARVGSIEVFDSGDSGRLREEEAEYRHVFEIETVEENQVYRVTWVVDAEYLADAVYPVTVDPVVTIENALNSTKIKDIEMYKNSSGAFSKYEDDYLGAVDNSGPESRILVAFPNLFSHFDVPQYISAIKKADLWMYDTSRSTTFFQTKVYHCRETWGISSSTVVQNDIDNFNSDATGTNFTARNIGGSPAAGYNTVGNTGSGSGRWYNFSVMDALSAWVSSSNPRTPEKGIMIKAVRPSGVLTVGTSFYSSHINDASVRSRLIFDYQTKLEYLKAKFPQNQYWNHTGSTNNPDGTTGNPCSSHSKCKEDGSCGCNSQCSAIQCLGFVVKLSHDIYGRCYKNTHGTAWSTSQNASYIDNIKAGDIIMYRGSSSDHFIMVTGVNGNNVTYAHANWDGLCKISWDVTTTKSVLKVGLNSNFKFWQITFAPYAIPVV